MRKFIATLLIMFVAAGASFAQSAETETAATTTNNVISLQKAEDGTYSVKSSSTEVPASKSASLEKGIESKSGVAGRATESISGKPACSGAAAAKPACGASGAKPACCKSKAAAKKADEPN